VAERLVSAARDIAIQVPWTISESGPVEIDVTAQHATRDAQPRSDTVAFNLTGNSAVPIPNPSPVGVTAAIGAALGLAQATRSRRV
jgi:hypothetical protein